LLLSHLQLIHLADSALPIGSAAHTFGLETLVSEGGLSVEMLDEFFTDYLFEMGQAEAVFCRAGYEGKSMPQLNARFSATRPARESRDASLKLGRRFLRLAASLIAITETESHFCIAFGLVGRMLALDADLVCAAYLHQSLFGQLSVCQRLLPLGQTQATGILWRLKPRILQAVEASKSVRVEDIWSCQPALEIGSMRHPRLDTRLFMS
jgi:urease accessory protein